MAKPWVVIGCGGHGREVVDVLAACGHQVVGFLDDNPSLAGTTVGALPILGGLEWLGNARESYSVALGIGSSQARKAVQARILGLRRSVDFPPIVHPHAVIGSRVTIGEGTLVQAGCILTCDIHIGRFVVLNICVGLSHDVRIDDFATIGPKSQFTGASACGALAEVGASTVVIPRCSIGEKSVTGAGSVVIRHVAPGNTVAGVPAVPIGLRSTDRSDKSSQEKSTANNRTASPNSRHPK